MEQNLGHRCPGFLFLIREGGLRELIFIWAKFKVDLRQRLYNMEKTTRQQ